jgi:hypothetical protein
MTVKKNCNDRLDRGLMGIPKEGVGVSNDAQRSWGVLSFDQAKFVVIYSRICRTTDAVVALMEVVSMYTAFVVVAKWVDPTLISADSGLARLAIPSAVVLAVMSLADAYSDPQGRWPLKPLFAPTLGFAVAFEQSMYVQVVAPSVSVCLGQRDRLDIRLDTAGGIPTRYRPTPSRQRSGILAEVGTCAVLAQPQECSGALRNSTRRDSLPTRKIIDWNRAEI